MEISIKAIEQELAVAQANAGRPTEATALARAQIIATLLGPQSAEYTFEPELIPAGSDYFVPDRASWVERIEIAAQILGYDPDTLGGVIARFDQNPDPQDPPEPEPAPTPTAAVVLSEDDDPDEDFFAEARKGRKK